MPRKRAASPAFKAYCKKSCNTQKPSGSHGRSEDVKQRVKSTEFLNPSLPASVVHGSSKAYTENPPVQEKVQFLNERSLTQRCLAAGNLQRLSIGTALKKQLCYVLCQLVLHDQRHDTTSSVLHECRSRMPIYASR
eukprot:GHVQ01023145.1.p3 GENE.GHVQ01023145.1~~GHVQ01023145.1.p3  ORF type:complete len:136 (-),score=6.27 GHVQ01023145.1:1929-2336(-)